MNSLHFTIVTVCVVHALLHVYIITMPQSEFRRDKSTADSHHPLLGGLVVIDLISFYQSEGSI